MTAHRSIRKAVRNRREDSRYRPVASVAKWKTHRHRERRLLTETAASREPKSVSPRNCDLDAEHEIRLTHTNLDRGGLATRIAANPFGLLR